MSLETFTPAESGDAYAGERRAAPENLSVQFPASSEQAKQWKNDLDAARDSFSKGSGADNLLPAVFIDGMNTSQTNAKGGSDGDSVREKDSIGAASGDRDAGTSSTVRSETEFDAVLDHHMGSDGDADMEHDTKLESVPNMLSYQFNARVDEVNEERSEQFQQGTESQNLFADKPFPKDAADLMIRALNGDVLTGTMPPPAGFDQISIYDLKVRKEVDGQVLLIAPGASGSNSDGVAVVREDGRPVSAMELGKYLRPDGTIVLDENGKALKRDDFITFASLFGDQSATPTVLSENLDSTNNQVSTDDDSTDNQDSDLVAKSSEKNDSESKEPLAALEDLDRITDNLVALVSNIELSNLSTDTMAGNAIAAEKLASERELKEEAQDKAWQQKSISLAAAGLVGTPLAVLQTQTVLALATASEIENLQARASLAVAFS